MSTVRILSGDGFGGRKVGSPGGKKAQAYLVDAFRAAGLKGVPGYGYRQRMRAGANIIGLLEGRGPLRDEVVVVGAHFDHLGTKGDRVFPGANDNASGIATLLATATMLAGDEPSERRTLLFVAFDAEEAGLLGSKHFVAEPPVDRGLIAAAVILDMVATRAHQGFGDQLVVLGTEKSPELQAIVAGIPEPEGMVVSRLGLHVIEQLPFRHAVWSDYGPFRDRAIPVAFLTSGVNPTYHQPTDTADSVSPTQLVAASLWTERLVRKLAVVRPRPRFEHAREDIPEDLRQVSRALKLALDPRSDFSNPLVRPAKLRAHQVRLDQLHKRLSRGATLRREEIAEIRAAALRISCYAGGPDSPFSSLCNAF